MKRSAHSTRRDFLTAAAAFGGMSLALRAAEAQPSPGAILTIVPAPGAAAVHFSDADLAAMPTVSFRTGSIWTEGIHEFAGPSLATVLEAAGLSTGVREIRLTALNDYSVKLSVARIGPEVPIVANRIDGAPFGVREKGPLWLVFPYDSAPRYRAESVYAVSVWQLRHIEAL